MPKLSTLFLIFIAFLCFLFCTISLYRLLKILSSYKKMKKDNEIIEVSQKKLIVFTILVSILCAMYIILLLNSKDAIKISAAPMITLIVANIISSSKFCVIGDNSFYLDERIIYYSDIKEITVDNWKNNCEIFFNDGTKINNNSIFSNKKLVEALKDRGIAFNGE